MSPSMKPYYQSDRVTLYHGDCLAVLPTLGKVDAVVTDPPYGISYCSGPISSTSISSTGKRFSETITNDDQAFDPLPFLLMRLPTAFTGAQYFYDRLPMGGSLHCWDKRGDYVPLDQADADMVWLSQPKACRTFHLVWRGLCRHDEIHEPFVHPTQKPISLMKWIISLIDGHIEIVLDPFMGSGTTGVACIRTGRKFIGIEIEERYCEIAAKRIQREEEVGAMFRQEPEQQAEMFKP